MKTLFCVALLVVAVTLSFGAQAQVLCALGPTTAPYDSMADMPASAAAQADLKKLKSLLCSKGCGKVFLFANATTPNTSTVTDGAGASKISYSPAFLASVQKTYGPIAVLGILAHELGHHLDASGTHAGWMKEGWDPELRADAWAGCAMAKAELKPSGLQAALLALSTYPAAAHPEWSERRAVITEGYTQCGGRILPPLSKEHPEQAAKVEDRGDDGPPVAAAAPSAPGGCTSDHHCRNGRMCLNGRCGSAPAHRKCGKDTDCPEPQECSAAGYCAGPAAQARAEETPGASPAPPKVTSGEMLAALEATPKHGGAAAAPAAPAADVAACRHSCDEARNQCVEAATGEATKCLAPIQSDPSYRACSCPNYPAGNYGCYRFCSEAYERGKTCSAAVPVASCRAESDRCRAQCP
jgi:hypothetical protein